MPEQVEHPFVEIRLEPAGLVPPSDVVDVSRQWVAVYCFFIVLSVPLYLERFGLLFAKRFLFGKPEEKAKMMLLGNNRDSICLTTDFFLSQH
ncbi:hypothetical protein [Noviherbaspirillum album]|nr:hypothetical protein [Noviherbaspirillum sp. CPCC 100848]